MSALTLVKTRSAKNGRLNSPGCGRVALVTFVSIDKCALLGAIDDVLIARLESGGGALHPPYFYCLPVGDEPRAALAERERGETEK